MGRPMTEASNGADYARIEVDEIERQCRVSRPAGTNYQGHGRTSANKQIQVNQMHISTTGVATIKDKVTGEMRSRGCRNRRWPRRPPVNPLGPVRRKRHELEQSDQVGGQRVHLPFVQYAHQAKATEIGDHLGREGSRFRHWHVRIDGGRRSPSRIQGTANRLIA
jgi:hypothetical protein